MQATRQAGGRRVPFLWSVVTDQMRRGAEFPCRIIDRKSGQSRMVEDRQDRHGNWEWQKRAATHICDGSVPDSHKELHIALSALALKLVVSYNRMLPNVSFSGRNWQRTMRQQWGSHFILTFLFFFSHWEWQKRATTLLRSLGSWFPQRTLHSTFRLSFEVGSF